MPLFAVGKGDVLHLLPVQHMIPDELVVGQDAGLGQAKAVHPAGVVRVGGFARFLGRGVHDVGGVHAAGTHAQHDAVVVVEQPRQAQLSKKVVLGGHVPAAQHHKAALGQKRTDLLGIAGITGDERRQGQVGVRKTLSKHPAHLVVLLVGIGVCRNGKAQHGVIRPDGPQVRHKVVARVQHRNIRPRLKGAAAGAAGQKQCHNDSS